MQDFTLGTASRFDLITYDACMYDNPFSLNGN